MNRLLLQTNKLVFVTLVHQPLQYLLPHKVHNADVFPVEKLAIVFLQSVDATEVGLEQHRVCRLSRESRSLELLPQVEQQVDCPIVQAVTLGTHVSLEEVLCVGQECEGLHDGG